MANRDYNYRRYKRYVKGMKRLQQDRAQHGGRELDRPDSLLCPCFADEAGAGRGREFARFADTPTPCSGWCCGNPRKWYGDLTLQEQKQDLPE